MHKRTRALAIPKAVKDRVWERDEHICIYCGSPYAAPEAHFIPRSHGGLGIEQNVVTLCRECHRRYDQTVQRESIKAFIRSYLKGIYADWDENNLIYRRE